MPNAMYTVIKNHIKNGEFKLNEIISRIRQECFVGMISEVERDELVEAAHAKANPINETPDVLNIIEKLVERIESLELQVGNLINSGITDEPEDPSETVYPTWKAWDGISKDYQIGAIVSHNDKLWESTYAGQNVWEPGAVGIDERYWKEYVV